MPPPTGPAHAAEPDELQLAERVVSAATGGGVDQARVLQRTADRYVLRVTTGAHPSALVLKVVREPVGPALDVTRTAAVMRAAGAAGVPVARVLDAGALPCDPPVQYLLTEHVEGTPWRDIRPTLRPQQVRQAHEALADAVLALQTIRFDGFGELDADLRPAGGGLRTALARRAELRVTDVRWRAAFLRVLAQEADVLDVTQHSTLTHDDVHHGNLVFRRDGGGWALSGMLDWDKAWAGPPESDVARMAFWDGMTGPGFWARYRLGAPVAAGWQRRALVHQLLWCLEGDRGTARHAADTARVAARLGVADLDM